MMPASSIALMRSSTVSSGAALLRDQVEGLALEARDQVFRDGRDLRVDRVALCSAGTVCMEEA